LALGVAIGVVAMLPLAAQTPAIPADAAAILAKAASLRLKLSMSAALR